MKIEQHTWTQADGWDDNGEIRIDNADLVLAFGGSNVMRKGTLLEDLRRFYPGAHVVGCSTSGEIAGTHVTDDSLVATAIHFDSTRVQTAHLSNHEAGESFETGRRLASNLDPVGLRHVLVLSDGQRVNGSDLVRGMMSALPPRVTVTGGLAGDGARFAHTYVAADGAPAEHQVAAIGFYGDHLKIGYGSLGGWDPFGPHRLVTRSKGNVLYELDGQPALALYKKYLGEHAAGLPATGLLFPLSVRIKDARTEVVRTILSVNEADQSLTFAGDMPEGSMARFMKANFDRLVDGAQGAARTSYQAIGSESPELAILISCVGRKLVLKQRTEEELEAVRGVLGARPTMTGFYSYGEICPSAPNADCELHNQTMTITTFSEN